MNFFIKRCKEDIFTEMTPIELNNRAVNVNTVHSFVMCLYLDLSGILGIWIDSEEVLPHQDEYKSIVFELSMLGFL